MKRKMQSEDQVERYRNLLGFLLRNHEPAVDALEEEIILYKSVLHERLRLKKNFFRQGKKELVEKIDEEVVIQNSYER